MVCIVLHLRRFAAFLAAGLVLASPGLAGAPDVEQADLRKGGMGWDISVTLRHPDTGWDHYADGWEVLDADGNRLGYRELHHPHVHKQPFTRSLHDVVLPDGTRTVFVRARCSRDGWAEETRRVVTPRDRY